MGIASSCIQEAKTSEKVHAATAHDLQLAQRIVVCSRFSENLAVKAGHLVAANDQSVAVRASDGACLGFRQA